MLYIKAQFRFLSEHQLTGG